MTSGNSKEAYNTLKALTKTQQHKSAVIDTSLPHSNKTPTQETESLPVLREEVRKAVYSLKAGKSPEWTTFPMSCLKVEARQQKQS